jgi:hypothetical protein
MTRLIPLLLLLSGCSVDDARDPQDNCAKEFSLMARGAVSCEEIGDRCAYTRDSLTGHETLTSVDDKGAYWYCVCGGKTGQIRFYWCESVEAGQASK